jgi:Glycosyltransferases involved in cell wall biogenesis
MRISIVIPCYNSEDSIEGVVDNIKHTLNTSKRMDYEIVLVNDCSNDNTFEKIKKIAKANINILGISLAYNSGQHNAILAGMRYTSGEYIMVCNDDGQTPFEAIDEMIEQLEQGRDAVCIKYVRRKQRNIFRKIGTKADALVANWLIEQPRNIEFSIDFIAKRFVINELIKYNGPYCYMSGLLFRTTKNVGNVMAVQRERKAGQSGYTLKKLLKLWMNGFTAFSIKPLRISAKIGSFFCFIGFAITIVLVFQKIAGLQVDFGWTFLSIIILVSSGLIMILLGLIGEYVGRIYMCLNSSPQFVIKETVNIKE